MYHLKDDLRNEKSAELLYKGVKECLKTTPFDKLKIQDVANAATVSRATFYRNFDSIIDILNWKCDRLFHQVVTEFIQSDPDLNDPNGLIRYVFAFWMDHVDLVELVLGQGRIDIFYQAFMNNGNMVLDYIKEQTGHIIPYADYFNATRVGIFIGVMQTWIDGGKKESLDEITNILDGHIQLMARTKYLF